MRLLLESHRWAAAVALVIQDFELILLINL